MMWDVQSEKGLDDDIDTTGDYPQFWTCANCRSLEPIGEVTLIGKIPLCQECCGSKGKATFPAGGVEEIVARILERHKSKGRNGSRGGKPGRKRRAKERRITH